MSKSSYKRISGKPHDVQWRLYEKNWICVIKNFNLNVKKQNWGRLYYLAGLFRAMVVAQPHC